MSTFGAVDNDARLLEALRDGDERAFSTLVEAYGPMMLRLALMHVPSRAVAEEVVQETWLAVLKGDRPLRGTLVASHLDHLDPPEHGPHQGRARAANAALLAAAPARGGGPRRALAAARALPGPPRPAPGPVGAGAPQVGPPEERLASDAARKVMLEAIAVLPPRQRDVIALRDVSGWSSEEVRNALALSETNQRVLLHRARSKVRAALEKHFEAEGVGP